MLTLEDRARAVIIAAYAKLPTKHLADAIYSVGIADLGKHNGEYNVISGRVRLNYRLFNGITPNDIPMIDDHGNFMVATNNIVSRALHTTIHEFSHAIGENTELDRTPDWLSICGWLEWPYNDHPMMPMSYSRYIETRPGWEPGPSEWVYRADSWFPREYSSKSPYEDFADCMALKALGWEHRFGFKHGLKKLHYIERRVFGEDRLTQSVMEKYTGAVLSTTRMAAAVSREKAWISEMNSSGKVLL